MPASESLSDDVVAELLKKDAKESSTRYSAVGLKSFLPKRPTTSAPKPNTRFLRNIIRETDSHNAALLAKEAEESRARLGALRRDDGKTSRDKGSRLDRPGSGDDEEKRRMKRRRVDGNDGRERESRSRLHEGHSRHSTHRRKSQERYNLKRHRRDHDELDERDGHGSKYRKSRPRERSNSEEGNRPTERHRTYRRRHDASKSPSRSASREQSSHHRHHHHRHHRSRRKRHDRSASPSRSGSRSRSRSTPTKPHDEEMYSTKRAVSPTASDSDPLEAIIGPPPPPKVKSRGRGTFASAAAMDSHFSTSYDPSADVHPDSDSENDWDQALEALRDRQRWKQQGADRLRLAGFTEDEVRKWEKGGEKTEQDVRWAKKGEGREWDRGKVVDDDGDVGVKPEWGRLKGT